MTSPVAGLFNMTGVLLARSQTGPEDEGGTPTWETVAVPVRCNVQPRSGIELLTAASAGITTWVGFFPPDTVVDTADALVLDNGWSFELEGPPRPWPHPLTTEVWYSEVDLKRIDRPEFEEESS
jgi:hypothetical protein